MEKSCNAAANQMVRATGVVHILQSGFTLIEVLVAIVVLSFGVLGVVGLQAAAIKSNQEAKYQMIAVQLAREFADMVRGNRAVGSGDTNNPYLAIETKDGMTVATTPNYCLAVGSTCATGFNVAQAQLTAWLAQVNAALPTARVVVCFDEEPYSSEGLPRWDCSGGTSMAVKIGWTRTALDKSKTGANALDFAAAENSAPAVLIAFTP
jgi:type IV pilus assembly protein PilV